MADELDALVAAGVVGKGTNNLQQFFDVYVKWFPNQMTNSETAAAVKRQIQEQWEQHDEFRDLETWDASCEYVSNKGFGTLGDVLAEHVGTILRRKSQIDRADALKQLPQETDSGTEAYRIEVLAIQKDFLAGKFNRGEFADRLEAAANKHGSGGLPAIDKYRKEAAERDGGLDGKIQDSVMARKSEEVLKPAREAA